MAGTRRIIKAPEFISARRPRLPLDAFDSLAPFTRFPPRLPFVAHASSRRPRFLTSPTLPLVTPFPSSPSLPSSRSLPLVALPSPRRHRLNSFAPTYHTAALRSPTYLRPSLRVPPSFPLRITRLLPTISPASSPTYHMHFPPTLQVFFSPHTTCISPHPSRSFPHIPPIFPCPALASPGIACLARQPPLSSPSLSRVPRLPRLPRSQSLAPRLPRSPSPSLLVALAFPAVSLPPSHTCYPPFSPPVYSLPSPRQSSTSPPLIPLSPTAYLSPSSPHPLCCFPPSSSLIPPPLPCSPIL
ncbi:unnamed protein product [Closterium sp. NIES-53]